MDVAVALNNLLNATKSASGKTDSDPAFGELKTNAKVIFNGFSNLILMQLLPNIIIHLLIELSFCIPIFKGLVESVSSLIKTVTTVGTSSARGLRALESTIKAISHELQVFIRCENFGLLLCLDWQILTILKHFLT